MPSCWAVPCRWCFAVWFLISCTTSGQELGGSGSGGSGSGSSDSGGWARGDEYLAGSACSIQRVGGGNEFLTSDAFFREYYGHIPVIIVNASRNAALREATRKDELLNGMFRSRPVQLRQSVGELSLRHEPSPPLADWVRSLSAPSAADAHGATVGAKEEDHLYMFSQQPNLQDLLDMHEAPSEYMDTSLNASRSLGMAGPGSGLAWHFHAAALAETVWGRKRWFLSPPTRRPVFDPAQSMRQWYDEWYIPMTQLQPGLGTEMPAECTLSPGEILYVPAGWWHATLNVDETVFTSLLMDASLDEVVTVRSPAVLTEIAHFAWGGRRLWLQASAASKFRALVVVHDGDCTDAVNGRDTALSLAAQLAADCTLDFEVVWGVVGTSCTAAQHSCTAAHSDELFQKARVLGLESNIMQVSMGNTPDVGSELFDFISLRVGPSLPHSLNGLTALLKEHGTIGATMPAATGYESLTALSHPDFQDQVLAVGDNLPSSNPLSKLPERRHMFAETGRVDTAPTLASVLDDFASAGMTVAAFLHPAQYKAASFLKDDELLSEIVSGGDRGDIVAQALVAESLAGPLNVEHQMYLQRSGVKPRAVRTTACSMNLVPKLLALQQSNLTSTIFSILAGRGFVGTLHRATQRPFPTMLMNAINGQKNLFLLYASLEHVYDSWDGFCEDYEWLSELLVSLNLMHTSWKSPEIADAAHFVPSTTPPALGTNTQLLVTLLGDSAQPAQAVRLQLVKAIPVLKSCQQRLIGDIVTMLQRARSDHPQHVSLVTESVLLSVSLGEFRCKVGGQLHFYGQGEKTCHNQRSLLQKTTYLYSF